MPAKKSNPLAAAKAKVAKLEAATQRQAKIEAAKKQLEKAKATLKAAKGTSTKRKVPSALKAHQFKKKA